MAAFVSSTLQEFSERGFSIARGFASNAVVVQLRGELAEHNVSGRGLLESVSAIEAFASSEAVLKTMRVLLGPQARAVRAFALDKTAEANWAVPWHQDVMIAVRERRDVAGFDLWSVKNGATHVRPPIGVLEGMASLRLHLDDAPINRGPLLVAVATHRRGIIEAERTASVAAESEIVRCECYAGDAILARPLLLHASRRSRSPARRRILHIEFASEDLPEPLLWRRF